MLRAATALALLLLTAPAFAATPDATTDAPVTIEQARQLVIESELAVAFRTYTPAAATQVRLLVVLDRSGRRADLALAADGSLWMVSRGRARLATNRDLAAAHIDRARLRAHLQARKIRPIALRIPRRWIVTVR